MNIAEMRKLALRLEQCFDEPKSISELILILSF